MPDQYAHYRFGKQLLPALPPEARQCIQRFRRMYDMGLQGPDIFYYYNPFWDTDPGTLGQSCHSNPGSELFSKAALAADSEAALSYLYGLLAHYCLDSVCHPQVNRLANIGEVRHVALEKEFDRHLLTLDGNQDPGSFDFSPRLKLTRGECMTVAQLYSGVTGAQVSRSVHRMAALTRFLSTPNRSFKEKLVGKFCPNFLDYFLPTREIEDYALYTAELMELYAQALARYPRLLEQLNALRTEKTPLGEDFSLAFG